MPPGHCASASSKMRGRNAGRLLCRVRAPVLTNAGRLFRGVHGATDRRTRRESRRAVRHEQLPGRQRRGREQPPFAPPGFAAAVATALAARHPQPGRQRAGRGSGDLRAAVAPQGEIREGLRKRMSLEGVCVCDRVRRRRRLPRLRHSPRGCLQRSLPRRCMCMCVRAQPASCNLSFVFA